MPEQSNRSGGMRVVLDGTLCDDLNLQRGYWEAKGTDSYLDAEIARFSPIAPVHFGEALDTRMPLC